MLTMLRRFLWDEAYATQYLRFLGNGIGAALISGAIPLDVFGENGGKWLGVLCMALAVFFRAGDKNQAPVA